MADTKITGLQTPQVTTNPATDVLPIVNIADNSMAASGSTRKITVNQLLGAGGTATLASATITGDLTVDTSTLKVDSGNDRVGVGTASPTSKLHVSNTGAVTRITITDDTTNGRSGYIESNFSDALVIGTTSGVRAIRFSPDNKPYYQIATDGVQTWLDGIGGTRMTLNATGLGVGGSPSGNAPMVLVEGAAGTYAKFNSKVGAKTWSAGYRSGTLQYEIQEDGTERFVIANGGNVGIGVTPSYKLHVNGRVSYSTGIGEGADLTLSSTGTQVQHGISSTWTSQNFYTGGTSRVVMKQNGQVRFVPLAADPAGAEAGDVYYNSTSNKLKCYNGTTWNDLF